MKAENYGGEIDGDEAEEYVRSRMIIMGDKCIWGGDGVEVCLVTPAEEVGGARVKNKSVRVILYDLEK